MKVVFMMNGLTHYYNLVLSKLNNEPDINLVVIVPTRPGAHIGAGVYQTREGINFKVIELVETHLLPGLFPTFRGLAGVLLKEEPDVIVVNESYVNAFLFDISVVIARKKLQAGLILRSIPFRHLSYQDARQAADKTTVGFSQLAPFINRFLLALGVIRLVRRALLATRKRAYCLVDAHVNYVEAFEMWDSYGIPRENIFITRNSPDTDLLFGVKDTLANSPTILPHNPYRLLHVGRLVESKRVDMLIRAFARLRSRFPGAELLIIGSGPEEHSLKKLRDNLDLKESVVFAGGVYDKKLLGKYFLASSLYVLAGMGGLSINEAMCFGLPILCSVCDGTEKILVQEAVNGRYFIDGDEDDLVDKITWFLDHPEKLQEMGRKSVEIIRNDVNIHTVLDGYVRAFNYVKQK